MCTLFNDYIMQCTFVFVLLLKSNTCSKSQLEIFKNSVSGNCGQQQIIYLPCSTKRKQKTVCAFYLFEGLFKAINSYKYSLTD